MTKVIYACEGTCAGQVEAAMYLEGSRTCGDKNCTKFGAELTPFNVCEKCWGRYKDGEKHTCAN